MANALSNEELAGSPQGTPNWRRPIPALRFAGTGVMFYVLITKVNWSSLDQIGQRGIKLIVLAFFVTIFGIFLSSVRWDRVLRALGVRLRMRDLVEMQFAGMFAGNFMPSTVGGDVMRASWVARISKAKSDSQASVVLERLTGWLVLPILVLLGVVMDPSVLHLGSISKVIVAVAGLTLFALSVLVSLVRTKRTFGVTSPLRFLNSFLASISRGISKLESHPAGLARLLGWSFLYQLCVIAASILAAKALSVSIGWREMLVFVPTVAMLQVLPLTIGGLGVREGALVLLLRPLGIDPAQAIAFGLLVYALNISASLLGAPSFAFSSARKFTEVEVADREQDPN